jgi:ferric-dicitrate binding protein FerR (iron transport regulator)
MSDVTNAELLIEDYFDGRLSEEGGKELVSWLDRDPANVDVFLLHVDMHASLFEELTEVPATGEFRAVRPKKARMRRPSRILSWVPVAAAAAVLLAVGIWIARPVERAVPVAPDAVATTDVGDILTIVRKSGSVTVTGDSVTTGADSWCVGKYRDGTLLAMDQNTGVGLSLDRTNDRKSIDLRSGRTFLDVTPQKESFTIAAGQTQTEILGTKLQVLRKEQTFVSMVDGLARVTGGGSGVYARGRQTVQSWPTNRRSITVMDVARMPQEREIYGWLEKTGIDVDELLARAGERAGLPKGAQIDFDNYTVLHGVWNVERGKDGVVVRQERLPGPRDFSTILFGTDKWKHGMLSFDVRMIDGLPLAGSGKYAYKAVKREIKGDQLILHMQVVDAVTKKDLGIYPVELKLPDIPEGRRNDIAWLEKNIVPNVPLAKWGLYAAFNHGTGTDFMGISDSIREFRKYGDWIRVECAFAIGKKNNLVTDIKAYAAGKKDTARGWKFEKRPDNSRIKERTRCRVGVTVTGCTAEFKNIRLVKAK